MKLKIFGTTKETISKVKRQPSEWEKIRQNLKGAEENSASHSGDRNGKEIQK